MRIRSRLRRWLDPFGWSNRDSDLGLEIDTHLSLLADEFVAQGMSPDEARQAAMRAFGNIDRLRMDHRDQGGLPALDRLVQDVRGALRVLRRDRGFAVTATLVLGLGIGITHMFVTIVYTHTMRGLPLAEPDRVVAVGLRDAAGVERPLSLADFTDVREATTSFDSLVAYLTEPIALADEGRAPERVDGGWVSASPFRLAGAPMVMGRDFDDGDHRPGAERVVILGEHVWDARYGRAPDVLGRTVLVDTARATVVGVAPDRTGFPSRAGVWLPLAQHPAIAAEHRADRRLQVAGRLRSGVAVADAQAQVSSAVARMARANPTRARASRRAWCPSTTASSFPWPAPGSRSRSRAASSCSSVAPTSRT
ncbi:MAG: ABC transporter permease [Vicinamibacterales bacterium]